MKYINIASVLGYLDGLRVNRKVNTSPHIDNALLNLRQIIHADMCNALSDPVFEYVDIESCDGCKWRSKRHQKCSCCRRNKHMRDLWEGDKNAVD